MADAPSRSHGSGAGVKRPHDVGASAIEVPPAGTSRLPTSLLRSLLTCPFFRSAAPASTDVTRRAMNKATAVTLLVRSWWGSAVSSSTVLCLGCLHHRPPPPSTSTLPPLCRCRCSFVPSCPSASLPVRQRSRRPLHFTRLASLAHQTTPQRQRRCVKTSAQRALSLGVRRPVVQGWLAFLCATLRRLVLPRLRGTRQAPARVLVRGAQWGLGLLPCR